MAFKDSLRNLRKTHHYTQEDLAKLTGLSKSTISMYENGNREPSFETLELLADYFNVDMNMLIGKQEIVVSGADDDDKDKPLSAKEFLQRLCQGDKQALAAVERLQLTDDGKLQLTGADMHSQAIIDFQVQTFIAALKSAKLEEDGLLHFEFPN